MAAGKSGPWTVSFQFPCAKEAPALPIDFQSVELWAAASLQIGHHECMRSFNTTGPVDPQDHYCIRPLDRVDLDYVLSLIAGEKYFTLHAPRQTGKTSALLALQDLLNREGDGSYRCVYVNLETGQAARENVYEAMRVVLGQLASRARQTLEDPFVEEIAFDILKRYGAHGALVEVLTRWAAADPRPLVLLIDEIDALEGDALLSVLRQLRSGFDRRPTHFPHSVLLCGVREPRDYRIHATSRNEPVMGGSGFNISAASLRLSDFSRAEVEALLAQHTAESGQAFRPQALERIWTQTQGQPWLVNALCDRACFRSDRGRDRARPIEEDAILAAQEQLILQPAAQLAELADNLQEERVRRVLEPLLSGAELRFYTGDDLQYVRDLGLIAPDAPPRLANPIYREIVPRELTAGMQRDRSQPPR